MQKEQIKSIIASKGYTIISEKRLPNNCGDVLKLNNDCIINCFKKQKRLLSYPFRISLQSFLLSLFFYSPFFHVYGL